MHLRQSYDELRKNLGRSQEELRKILRSFENRAPVCLISMGSAWCRVVERRRVRPLRHSNGSRAGDQAPQRHDPARRRRPRHRQVRQQPDVAGCGGPGGGVCKEQQRTQHSGAGGVAVVHRGGRGGGGSLAAHARSTAQPRRRENQVHTSLPNNPLSAHAAEIRRSLQSAENTHTHTHRHTHPTSCSVLARCAKCMRQPRCCL